MTRSDRIALALSREIVDRLETEPVFVVQRGLANVDKARSKSRGTARMAVDRWNEMLMRSDIAAIRDTLLGDSDDAREMRNSAVFSGVIPEPRRMQIVRGVLNAA